MRNNGWRRLQLVASVLELVAVAAIFGAVGCGSRLQVDSNTGWTGYVHDHSVAGNGSQTFDINGGECATFQKSTDGGMVRARIKRWYGSGSWVETWAPYGVITLCEGDR
jgi:hypothetical protein